MVVGIKCCNHVDETWDDEILCDAQGKNVICSCTEMRVPELAVKITLVRLRW